MILTGAGSGAIQLTDKCFLTSLIKGRQNGILHSETDGLTYKQIGRNKKHRLSKSMIKELETEVTCKIIAGNQTNQKNVRPINILLQATFTLHDCCSGLFSCTEVRSDIDHFNLNCSAELTVAPKHVLY